MDCPLECEKQDTGQTGKMKESGGAFYVNSQREYDRNY